MKISVAWLFDHIDGGSWHTVDIPALIAEFNKKTAEIESWHPVTIDLNNLSLARVVHTDSATTTVESPEWRITAQLPIRKQCTPGNWYLITKIDDNKYTFATMHHLGSEKDIILPALTCAPAEVNGSWKKQFEATDYILEVDNKSITHRPDMWGHRGFAREVAALLNLPLKPLEHFVHTFPAHTAETHASVGTVSASIADATACNRFAALHVPTITNKPSLLTMAARLARVDSKPINALVDITNYVMLDLSQPMHAFDAHTVSGKKLIVSKAHAKQRLTLLDGETIELSSDDVVVCDDKQPIALAGIMGGKVTEVHNATTAVLLEAANFDATTIRLGAARHKKRTDASTRFEKSLDPNQNITAIERFLKLCDDADITYTTDAQILSLGTPLKPLEIVITHDFIEKKLGTSIPPKFIHTTLNALEYLVAQTDKNNSITYCITVPTFRCFKDVRIGEDIVEEIGRFFGYDTIAMELPTLALAPHAINSTMQERTIKNVLAYSGKMREVYTYSFFDESFLHDLQWQPNSAVAIKNPVSQNWQKLVTSLIPNLIKTVVTNNQEYDSLRFFESARIWQQQTTIVEKKAIAGIFFEKKETVDFYTAKNILLDLYTTLRIPVTWQRVDAPTEPWFAPHQTAHLLCEGKVIGTAGMINTNFLNAVSEGSAFIFELDYEYILHYKPAAIRVVSPCKYPEVVRDVSMLIPITYTSDTITATIASIDSRITTVTLIDFFYKPEWENNKSLTMRYVLSDHTKTLSSDEVDVVHNAITKKLMALGATIR